MHKKYIKKRGKKFGPYFYTTVRDRNGVARSYYLSQDHKEALRKEEELKSRLLKERERAFPVIPQKLYAAAFLAMACLFLFLGANFTGLFVSGETVQYSQDLGVGFTQSTAHTITLQSHPDQFYVNSLRLSGRVIGNGTAKVYIEGPDGERHLVIDHSPSQESLIMVTGFVPASGNQSIKIENETGVMDNETNETIPEEELNITEDLNETLNITANLTAGNETINATEDLNITANLTAGNETMNITANITEGINETLNITANLTAGNETMNITANITEGINETLNITANLTAGNETANETEADGEMTVYAFSNECVDTCLFTEEDGLNETSYRIIVELDEGTELFLESVNYTAVNMTVLVINETEEGLVGIDFEKVQNDPAFEVTLESASLDDGELFIRFSHNYLLGDLSVSVEGPVDYDFTQDIASARETVTLIVHGWENETFRLAVGSDPGEIIQFGTLREITFTGKIKDASGRGIAATIEIINPRTRSTVRESSLQADPVPPVSVPGGPSFAPAPPGPPAEIGLAEGTYDVRITPEGHVVKEIEVEGVEITDDFTELVNIDDAPETGGFEEVYAIDPTAINFTSATVTVTATGSSLYKCRDWDFEGQSCGGTWERTMSLVPGQDYTFTLTPEDPGYGEGSGPGIMINRPIGKTYVSAPGELQAFVTNGNATPDSVWYSLNGEQNTTMSRANTDWYRFRGNENNTGMMGSAPVTSNATFWKIFNASGTFDDFASPTVVDDVVYLGAKTNAGWARAYNATTGEQLWEFYPYDQCWDGAFRKHPDKDIIYMGCRKPDYHNYFYALNSTTGEQIWNWTAGGSGTFRISGSPAYKDDVVYFCNWYSPYRLWALNATTGMEAWNFSLSTHCVNSPALTYDSYDEEWVLYLGVYTSSNNLYAVYLNGTQKWRVSTGSVWDSSPVIVSNDILYHGTSDGKVYAVNRSNGATLWSKTGMTNIYSTITTDGESVYFTAGDGYLYSYNITDGSPDYPSAYNWRFSVGGGDAYGSPGLSEGGVVYALSGYTEAGTGRHVYAVNTTTGQEVWRYALGSNSFSSIVISDGILYVNADDQYLYAIGDQKRFTYEGSISPVEGENTVTVYTNDSGGALASDTVSFTYSPPDLTPPSPVTGLSNQSQSHDWIYWNWTSPADGDFSQAIIYINGSNVANTSDSHYNATGLSPSTGYEITVHTKDTSGNVNTTDVSSIASTGSEPDLTPPSPVTGLSNQSQSHDWIYWNWTNPEDVDFNESIVYLDGVWQSNTSDSHYNATGLSEGASYIITVHTKDTAGNVNTTDVNSTASTSYFVPVITGISASPGTQGFNQAVAIQANVTHAYSVLVGVTPPGSSETNHTMANDSGTYHYNHTTGWSNGTYSYVIYANNTPGNWYSSETYTFQAGQNLTVQLRTLKGTYGDGEIINLTDPPGGGPAITNAYVDPEKVRPGYMMLVSAEVSDASGIASVTAEMPHEGGTDTIELELVEGTVLQGTWQATWTVHDTLERDYVTTIRAVNTEGKPTEAHVQWSDPLGWISPTSHSDPDGKWTLESDAYDGSTTTYASDGSRVADWASFIVFNLSSSTYCDKVRAYADFGYGVVDSVDVDVFNDSSGTWADVYQGAISDVEWYEMPFEATNISAARFRFHYLNGNWYFWLYEFQFYSTAPTINPPAGNTAEASGVEETFAILHGNLTSDGGEPCQVRFEYGTTDSYGSATGWQSGIATGEVFSERLTGLEDGQTYHFRAQFNNSGGLVNGSDSSFTTGTASQGWVLPTGTYDPSGDWQYDSSIMDDVTSTRTRSYHNSNDEDGDWSFYFYLNRTPIVSSKVKFYASSNTVDSIDIDVHRDGTWTDVYQGSFPGEQWVEKEFSQGIVDNARFRLHASTSSSGFYWEMYEFDFWKSTEGITYTEFEGYGSTTDLSGLGAEDTNVSGLVLETGSGKIEFNQDVILNAGYDLDSAVDILPGNVFVDSSRYQSLGAAANVTMYNIQLGYPRVLKDGEECADCSITSWDTDTGELSFTVSSFSNYTLEEANQSKAVNSGSTTGSFYLLMKTQYFNPVSGWQDEDIVVNDTEPRELAPGGTLKLDDIWNPVGYNASNLSSGYGTYRVYAAVLDSQGSVMPGPGGLLEAYHNFTLNATEDVPPSSVTSLSNQSQGYTWIYWSWTNPQDPDFSQSIIHINGENVANTSDSHYNATGLAEDTSYTITVHTKDTSGNVNDTDVSSTTSTGSSADTTPPSVTNVLPSPGTQYNVTGTVTTQADVTDNIGIAWVRADITYPNGTTEELALTNYSAVTYGYNFTRLTQKGRYNVTFTANDTAGNLNTTETWFQRVAMNIVDLIQNETALNYTASVTSNESGILDLEIVPENHTIKNLTIHNYDERSEDSIVRITSTTEDAESFVQTYSIDPTGLNFTDGLLTVTAKGNYLYKCEDWNASEQLCYGNWTKWMKVTPGQNYTINITADDPGFGEINATDTEHLDLDYSYISNIFDEVKTRDNVWSERIYETQIARVTYESSLTNGNVIDVYVRSSNSSTTWFEVYGINTTSPVLGTSGMITSPTGQWIYITLANVTQPTNMFDFKVHDASPMINYLQFDYIHDAITISPFFDDFEYDNFSTVWTQDGQNDWFRNSQRSYSGGSYSAEVDGSATDATLKRAANYDISDYDSCVLSAQIYIENRWDNNEFICIDYSTDGGSTWNRDSGSPNQAGVGDLCVDGNTDTENTWHRVSHTVTGSGLTSQFTFRFRSTVSRSNEDGNVDHVNLTCYASERVNWNQSVLDIGSTTVQSGELIIGTAALSSSYGNNTNVVVTCDSGDCSKITDQWSDGTNVYEGQPQSVNFECDDSSAGDFLATFNVTSDEDAKADQMNVTCTVIRSFGDLDVELIVPIPNSTANVDQDYAFDVQANITCTGPDGVRCGLVSGTPRHNTTISGCSPNCPTNVQAETGFILLSGLTGTASLTNSYNISKAFIIRRQSMYTDDATQEPDGGTATIEWNDCDGDICSGLIATRHASDAEDAAVSYSILQADNIRVWNFTLDWASGENDEGFDPDPDLPADYADKCFVNIHRTTRIDSSTNSDYCDAEVRSNITSASNVTFGRDGEDDNAPQPGTTYGEVVCFLDGSNVQQVFYTMGESEPHTDNVPITAVNMSDAWAMHSHRQPDDGVGQNSILNNITSTNNLELFYDETGQTNAGDQPDVTAYVVEHEYGQNAVVRNFRISPSYNDQDITTDFSPAVSDLNRSLLVCYNSMASGGGTAHTRDYWTHAFVDSDTIRSVNYRTRTSSQTSYINCWIIEWPNETSLETTPNVGEEIMGAISTSSATPFWTSNSSPQSCGGTLWKGQVCQLNWSVNATGPIDSDWKIDVLFSSNESLIASNDTDDAEVNITAFVDTAPPFVTNVLPSPGTQYNVTGTVTIQADVTDNVGVMWVRATVTYPDSSSQQFNMTNYTADTYKYNFTDLGQKGRYNITIIANDTNGNENSTETTWFERVAQDVIDIIDENSTAVNFTSNVTSNVSGVIDIEILPENHNILNLTAYGHDESSESSVIRMSNETNESGFMKTFSVDLSDFNMTGASLTFTATGNHLFKCANFSFSTQRCADDAMYEMVMFLTPGQNYTIALNATDPGFGQTVQGPENTNDSTMRSGGSNTNYGGYDLMRVGRRISSDIYRGIIRFNISDMIPADANITDANLSLYFYQIPGSDNTGSRTHGAHKVQQSPPRDWLELNVTVNSYNGTDSWTSAGGDYAAGSTDNATFDSSNLSSWITWNVTLDVIGFYSSPETNFGWVIKDEDESSNGWRRDYRSKEYANASLRPRLDVSYYAPDTAAPSIYSLATDEILYGRNESALIFATVTDDFEVDTVFANISIPEDGYELKELSYNSVLTRYEGRFNSTDNKGTYNVTIWANDTSGNINDTEMTTFKIVAPNITAVKYDSPDPVQVGREVTYYINNTVELVSGIVPLRFSNIRSVTNSTDFKDSPQMIETSSGTLLIVYNQNNQPTMDGGNHDIWALRSTDYGQTWDEIHVTDEGGHDIFPNIMEDDEGNILIVYTHMDTNDSIWTSGDVWLVNSSNDGQTWDEPSALVTTGSFTEREPVMAQDSSGTYYVCYEGSDEEIHILNSTKFWEGWGSDTQMTNNSYGDVDLEIHIVNDTFFFAWAPFDDGNDTEQDIRFAKTTNPMVFNVLDDNAVDITNNTFREYETSITSDDSGYVYIAWSGTTNESDNYWGYDEQFNKTSNELFVALSRDFGDTWDVRMMTNNTYSDGYPGVVQTGANGLYYMASLIANEELGTMDIGFGERDYSPQDAINVTIRDTMPNSTHARNIYQGGNQSGNILTWFFTVIYAGQYSQVSFTALVNETVVNGTLLNNTANSTYVDSEGRLIDTIYLDENTTAIDGLPPGVIPVHPAPGETFNQTANLTITANITDNGMLDTVYLNVSIPGYGAETLGMSYNSTSGYYEANFTSTSTTGNYTVVFFANDTTGNVNSTESTYFSITNEPASTPDNITCNGGSCNATFNGTIEMQCSGSTDPNGDLITYYVEARYMPNEDDITSVNATFDSGNDSFVYQDDLYGTSQPTQANGSRVSSSRCANGYCISVDLNRISPVTGSAVSGGWNRTFNFTDTPDMVKVTFNYTLRIHDETEFYENVSIYYNNISTGQYVRGPRLAGSTGTNGIDEFSTGTVSYEALLVNGTYVFDAGCLLDPVDQSNEDGSCWIDDVVITALRSSDTEPKWQAIGNHIENSSFSWFIGATKPQENITFRCRAMDNGSLSYSGWHYEPNGTTSIDGAPPTVTDMSPPGTSFDIADDVRISARIKDNHKLDSTWANLTYPDNTSRTVQLTHIGGNIYVFDMIGVYFKGRYNVTFFANDSVGHLNDTETAHFFKASSNVIDVINATDSGINYTVNVTGNVSGLLGFTIWPENQTILRMDVAGYHEDTPYSTIRMNSITNEDDDFVQAYALDLSGFDFTEVNITVTATGNYLYKCEDFNMTSLRCNDYVMYNFTRLDLVPGQNYTVTLRDANDPGLGETLQGPENTSDSTMRSGGPDDNYGAYAFVRAGRRNAGDIYRPIIKFNLSQLDVPDGVTITDANLSLFFYRIPTGDNTGSRTHGAHKVQQSPIRPWTEFNVTANSYNGTDSWTSFGGDFAAGSTDNATFDSSNLSSWITWNVTLDVIGFYSSPETNFGWVIKDEDESSNGWRRDYRSKESNASGGIYRPRLDIGYTDPQPPDVTDLVPVLGTHVNNGSSVTITANVTDNINVSFVYANVTWDATDQALVMTDDDGDGTYNCTFTNTVQPDTYNVTIWANDTSNNINGTENTWFETLEDAFPPHVTDILPSAGTQYNYGDSVTINATVSDADSDVDTVIAQIRQPNGSVVNISMTVLEALPDSNTNLLLHMNNDSGLGENDTYFVDSGPYGNDGVCTGAQCPALVPGRFGNAWQFDGSNDNINISDDPTLDITGSLTLEAWVNITSYSNYDSIVGKAWSSSGDPYTVYALSLGSGAQNFGMRLTSGTTDTLCLSAAGSASTGQWTHVAGVWNGTHIQMYVNGILSGSPCSFSGPIATNDMPVYVGAYPYSLPTYLFNGAIDEVRISNTTRTRFAGLRYNATSSFDGTGLEGIYNVTIWANDTHNNINDTEQTYFTTPLQPPYWADNKTNLTSGTVAGNDAYFNVTLYDNRAPGYHIFSFYNGTDWANDTAQAWTNGTELEETRTITASLGMEIMWYWWFNDSAGNVNQTDIWSFNINNTPPTAPVLDTPVNDYNATELRPFFNWTASSDADSDPINYTLYITCNGGCSDDNREYNTSSNNYTLPSDLVYYGDDGYYYNWTVVAWDPYSSTPAATDRNFTVYTSVVLTLVNSTVDFGSKLIGESDNTTDSSPEPFVLRNDGNCFIDVNLSASDLLWDTQGSASRHFQFKADNVSGEEGSFNSSASETSWENVSLSDLIILSNFNFTNLTDEAEVDILIEVPLEEPPGIKSSNLVFTGEYVG